MPAQGVFRTIERRADRCWLGTCFLEIMNHMGHLPLSETARRGGKTKARRGRPPKNNTHDDDVRDMPAVGTLMRTKSLLLAALRVWELKHRITD